MKRKRYRNPPIYKEEYVPIKRTVKRYRKPAHLKNKFAYRYTDAKGRFSKPSARKKLTLWIRYEGEKGYESKGKEVWTSEKVVKFLTPRRPLIKAPPLSKGAFKASGKVKGLPHVTPQKKTVSGREKPIKKRVSVKAGKVPKPPKKSVFKQKRLPWKRLTKGVATVEDCVNALPIFDKRGVFTFELTARVKWVTADGLVREPQWTSVFVLETINRMFSEIVRDVHRLFFYPHLNFPQVTSGQKRYNYVITLFQWKLLKYEEPPKPEPRKKYRKTPSGIIMDTEEEL